MDRRGRSAGAQLSSLVLASYGYDPDAWTIRNRELLIEIAGFMASTTCLWRAVRFFQPAGYNTPTLTVIALALRLADHLKSKLAGCAAPDRI